MSFKKRLGTALRNINDIEIFGYPKGQEVQPEIQTDDRENCSKNFDNEDLDIENTFPGWTITVLKQKK